MKRDSLLWKNADATRLKGIRGVAFDIDDTFSSRGKITPEAYAALWRLKKAGYALAPITGRPAGWCDHIARFWPVDAVVGENGAFVFFMQNGVRKRIDTPKEFSREESRKKLEALGERIRAEFPEAAWASDQDYREFDLAIDYCEDVSPWPDFEVERLVELCKTAGAQAKVSSVHVNAWFGKYDKVTGFRTWLGAGAPGLNGPVPSFEQWLFIGDSPNDEPMFEAFAHSVGVANLGPFLDQIAHTPVWITDGLSGEGFVEMADRLLAAVRAK
ncbi:MAG TPA: HAD-IIB family hydrolase [Bdellovibrionota bacterium]|jgi:HAD superfamily hydrolase (TIGR01484 family)|nr:HAD-IIB family hydrolase [Bdellovibrionota bacterium]